MRDEGYSYECETQGRGIDWVYVYRIVKEMRSVVQNFSFSGDVAS